MKNPFADRIASATAAVGVLLMVFTILTYVNPVEGSVVRPRWLLSAWAAPIHLTLLVSSFPVLVVSGHLQRALLHLRLTSPGQFNLTVEYGTMLIFQGLLYFGIGKIISLSWRKLRCRKTAESTHQRSTTRPGLNYRQE